MRVITQPDGFVEVYDKGERIAYVDHGKLFLVGQGAPLGDVNDRSDIVRLLREYQATCG